MLFACRLLQFQHLFRFGLFCYLLPVTLVFTGIGAIHSDNNLFPRQHLSRKDMLQFLKYNRLA